MYMYNMYNMYNMYISVYIYIYLRGASVCQQNGGDIKVASRWYPLDLRLLSFVCLYILRNAAFVFKFNHFNLQLDAISCNLPFEVFFDTGLQLQHM